MISRKATGRFPLKAAMWPITGGGSLLPALIRMISTPWWERYPGVSVGLFGRQAVGESGFVHSAGGGVGQTTGSLSSIRWPWGILCCAVFCAAGSADRWLEGIDGCALCLSRDGVLKSLGAPFES